MEIVKKSIFVPWDFTDKAECAFDHALNLSNTFSKEIVLLNVVKKDKEVPEVESKLKEVAEQLQAKFNINVKYIIGVGDLFKTIPSVSKDNEASLIVMGMHSSKRSIKTVVGSEVPFYLIQEKPKRDKIVEVVVPIDTNDKNRVQLNWVTYLAKHFSSNINIIKPYLKSNSKNRKMKANMHFARKILDSKNIVYGIKTSKREEKWSHAISDFATSIDADLIFVMSEDFKKFMKRMAKEETKIPIICINPATGVNLLPGRY